MIAINAAILDTQPSGLGVFVKEITKHIQGRSKDVLIFTSCPDQFSPGVVYRVPNWVRTKFGSFLGGLLRFLWIQTVLPWVLWRRRVHVLLSPNHEAVFFCPCPQAVVIYDLLPLLYPDNYPKLRYYFRYFLPWVLRRTQIVVAGSENTKADLVRHYGLPASKITVIYAGVDCSRFSSVPQRRLLPFPYMLYVGNQYPYKNLARLLEAFAGVVRDGFPQNLVIVGKKDPVNFKELERKGRELNLDGRIYYLDYVKSEDLPILYSQAQLFVFPSLYEGFGLPTLEAMACGCPVAASSTSALREVCSYAARYFNPSDALKIQKVIEEMLGDQNLRESMIRLGFSRIREFSWDTAAEKYVALLLKLDERRLLCVSSESKGRARD